VKGGQFTLIVATALLAACPGPVIRNVSQTDIAGHVTDRNTGTPISGACLVASLAKGGFWTTPDQYNLGSACTDSSGAFRIPANPRRVWNVASPEEEMGLQLTAPGYYHAWFFPSPNATITDLHITLKPDPGGPVNP